MKRNTSALIAALTLTAIILGVVLLANNGNNAQASILNDQPGFTLMTAGAVGFIRRTLGPRLGLREVPELRFQLDTSIERGARVEDLLKRLESGEKIEEEEGS